MSSFDSSLIHCDSGAGSPGRTTSAGDSGSSAEPSLTSAPAAPTALAADEPRRRTSMRSEAPASGAASGHSESAGPSHETRAFSAAPAPLAEPGGVRSLGSGVEPRTESLT